MMAEQLPGRQPGIPRPHEARTAEQRWRQTGFVKSVTHERQLMAVA
jgi:hypothetical protein